MSATIELKGLSQEDAANIVPPGTILLAYRGSIAHGMYVPPEKPTSIDDKDLMGVCVPGPAVYFGLNGFEQREVKYREWDSVVYEARKFVRLLVGQNPNVMSLLWNEPKYFLSVAPAGQLLLDNRQVFVSRKAYHSFTGYAYAQLKKMTHLAFQGYMGDKRKQLVEKFGYDTKNAAHLIRLLRMGIEFLREGVLYVDRGVIGDAPNLLSIKNGEWTLEQVKAEADRLFKRAETAYDECKLPRAVDTEKADALCQEIVRMGLGV
jgi:predicted nucleotidyltransferase